MQNSNTFLVIRKGSLTGSVVYFNGRCAWVPNIRDARRYTESEARSIANDRQGCEPETSTYRFVAESI